ncbi:hypothetical protein F4859DRAFT_443823 [Xylaria cf. heliscus]|nr:hypothetical protein F4859DRAFT_443823 [Xylaria cf. heliscus]
MADMHSTTLCITTDDAREIDFECKWARSHNTTIQHKGDTPIQIIDFVFSAISARPDGSPHTSTNTYKANKVQVQSGVFDFLDECLRAATVTPGPGVAVVRFVIPQESGTIIRSDIVSSRLRDAFWVEKAVSFASPLQVFTRSVLRPSEISLINVIRASAGAALMNPSAVQQYLRDGEKFAYHLPLEVESDFEDKLAISWISTEQVTRKRLILVGSSNQDPEGGGWTQFARHAAVALGIDLVFIDRVDGWLAKGNYTSWYEALIPAPSSWWADPSADELVKLVEDYKAKNKGVEIDGIATFIEALQVPVSVAASRLGLPHERTSAFERATNKYKLGLFQNRPAFLASNTEDVMTLVASPQNKLTFPLIVKPCYGLNSEGVTRVNDESELQEAIEAARMSGRSKSEVGDRVLVERYCDGPEVDVNMIFVDGEVLFSEICDDFPKGADVNNISRTGGDTATTRGLTPDQRRNFQETNMVFPSALPDNELAALKNAVEDTLKGLGFRNGVMHVEARIDQSRLSYQSAGGVVDLQPRQCNNPTTKGNNEPTTVVPTPWIIEVNPRPPGLFASQTPVSVYGIDYWGISLLLGAGDKVRAAALSRPFMKGAQNHTVLVMIRAEFDPTSQGIFDSDDVCAELLTRHPEFKDHLGRYGCLLKRGQRIPHPRDGKNTFVAYMNVFSRTSRQEALDIAEKVRKEVKYKIR